MVFKEHVILLGIFEKRLSAYLSWEPRSGQHYFQPVVCGNGVSQKLLASIRSGLLDLAL
jgi:hypothetical protein